MNQTRLNQICELPTEVGEKKTYNSVWRTKLLYGFRRIVWKTFDTLVFLIYFYSYQSLFTFIQKFMF